MTGLACRATCRQTRIEVLAGRGRLALANPTRLERALGAAAIGISDVGIIALLHAVDRAVATATAAILWTRRARFTAVAGCVAAAGRGAPEAPASSARTVGRGETAVTVRAQRHGRVLIRIGVTRRACTPWLTASALWLSRYTQAQKTQARAACAAVHAGRRLGIGCRGTRSSAFTDRGTSDRTGTRRALTGRHGRSTLGARIGQRTRGAALSGVAAVRSARAKTNNDQRCRRQRSRAPVNHVRDSDPPPAGGGLEHRAMSRRARVL